MTDSDDTSEGLRYRQVISREPPYWVVTVYGPGLPEHGASARSQTLDGLEMEARHLWPAPSTASPSGGASASIEYDFGPGVNAMLESFYQARLALRQAWRDYYEAGRGITSALAADEKASLREIASILHEGYWTAGWLHAHRSMESRLVDFHVGGVRHFLKEHAAPSIAHTAGIAARQARTVMADTLREAWRSCLDRANEQAQHLPGRGATHAVTEPEHEDVKP